MERKTKKTAPRQSLKKSVKPIDKSVKTVYNIDKGNADDGYSPNVL